MESNSTLPSKITACLYGLVCIGMAFLGINLVFIPLATLFEPFVSIFSSIPWRNPTNLIIYFWFCWRTIDGNVHIGHVYIKRKSTSNLKRMKFLFTVQIILRVFILFVGCNRRSCWQPRDIIVDDFWPTKTNTADTGLLSWRVSNYLICHHPFVQFECYTTDKYWVRNILLLSHCFILFNVNIQRSSLLCLWHWIWQLFFPNLYFVLSHWINFFLLFVFSFLNILDIFGCTEYHTCGMHR